MTISNSYSVSTYNKYGLYNEDDIGDDPSETIKKIESINKAKEKSKSKITKKNSALKVDNIKVTEFNKDFKNNETNTVNSSIEKLGIGQGENVIKEDQAPKFRSHKKDIVKKNEPSVVKDREPSKIESQTGFQTQLSGNKDTGFVSRGHGRGSGLNESGRIFGENLNGRGRFFRGRGRRGGFGQSRGGSSTFGENNEKVDDSSQKPDENIVSATHQIPDQPSQGLDNDAFTDGKVRPRRGAFRGRGNRGYNFGGFRQPRDQREFDRHSGSDKTGVKSIDKREEGGVYNWGTPIDDENFVTESDIPDRSTEEFGFGGTGFGRGGVGFGRGGAEFGRGGREFSRGRGDYGSDKKGFNRDREFGRGEGESSRESIEFGDSNGGFGRGGREFGRGVRGFSRGRGEHCRESKGFDRNVGEFGRGGRVFFRSGTEYNREGKGFDRSDKELNRGVGDFGRGGRGFIRGGRGFGHRDVENNRERKGFEHSDGEFGRGRGGFNRGGNNGEFSRGENNGEFSRGGKRSGHGDGEYSRENKGFQHINKEFDRGGGEFSRGSGGFSRGGSSGEFSRGSKEFGHIDGDHSRERKGFNRNGRGRRGGFSQRGRGGIDGSSSKENPSDSKEKAFTESAEKGDTLAQDEAHGNEDSAIAGDDWATQVEQADTFVGESLISDQNETLAHEKMMTLDEWRARQQNERNLLKGKLILDGSVRQANEGDAKVFQNMTRYQKQRDDGEENSDNDEDQGLNMSSKKILQVDFHFSDRNTTTGGGERRVSRGGRGISRDNDRGGGRGRGSNFRGDIKGDRSIRSSSDRAANLNLTDDVAFPALS